MDKIDSEAIPTEKRRTCAAHVLASIAAFLGAILLIVAVRSVADVEQVQRFVGVIGLIWLFLAFAEHNRQLGDRLEKRLGRGRDAVQTPASRSKNPDHIDWLTVTAWTFTFMTFAIVYGLARLGFDVPRPQSRKSEPRMYSTAEVDDVRKIIGAQSAKIGNASQQYWQTAVANLHSIRFETPSGQESAEVFYERMVAQLRQLIDAARSASTVNVDSELVQMVTRHLAIEDQFLQMKQKLDEFMKREKLPALKDTVDQRMAITQLFLGTVQDNSQILKNLPPGPERDFLEYGLQFEQKRLEQMHEVEIMQAVLQERYKGVGFPLPAIAQQ